jgi:hypothetical protein
MIIIVTTISVYLAVYKGIPIITELESTPDEPEAKDKKWQRWLRRRIPAVSVRPETPDATERPAAPDPTERPAAP